MRLTDSLTFSDSDLSPHISPSWVNVLFQCSDQVQQELSKVVGNRRVWVEDRKNLPYVDAVIHEVQRVGNIVPMAVPHKTAQDVEFRGYFLKKVKCLVKVFSRRTTLKLSPTAFNVIFLL